MTGITRSNFSPKFSGTRDHVTASQLSIRETPTTRRSYNPHALENALRLQSSPPKSYERVLMANEVKRAISPCRTCKGNSNLPHDDIRRGRSFFSNQHRSRRACYSQAPSFGTLADQGGPRYCGSAEGIISYALYSMWELMV